MPAHDNDELIDGIAHALEDPQSRHVMIDALRRKCRLPDHHDDPQDQVDCFNLCLKIIEMMTRYEEEQELEIDASVKDTIGLKGPTYQHSLTAMIPVLEWFVYYLGYNRRLDLRYQPFLSHWVESLHRSEQRLQDWVRTLTKPEVEAGSYSVQDRHAFLAPVKARIVILRAILDDQDSLQDFSTTTLESLLEQSARTEASSTDLSRFARMLQEEGVYDADQEDLSDARDSPVTQVSGEPPRNPNTAAEKGSGRRDMAEKRSQGLGGPVSAEVMLQLLGSDPYTAYQALTHLPVDLASLEVLNKVLASTAVARHFDPVELSRDYIQHGLRQIEAQSAAVGSLANMVGDGDSSNGEGSSTGPVANANDRGSSVRAIKLLVLFIRHLIRTGVAEPDRLIYEIQELCARYLWVKEVRDLQRFLEGAAEDEDTSGRIAGPTQLGG